MGCLHRGRSCLREEERNRFIPLGDVLDRGLPNVNHSRPSGLWCSEVVEMGIRRF